MNIKLLCLFLLICVVPLNAKTPTDHNKKGIDYGKQNNYNEAIKEFKQSLRISNRSTAKTLHNLAWACELTGRIKEAIRYYREAVKRNPRQTPSVERLGFLYYKTEKYTLAVKYGERVLKLDPTNSTVIEWLPDAYRKKLGVNMKDNIRKRIERLDKKRKKKKGLKKGKMITLRKQRRRMPFRQILICGVLSSKPDMYRFFELN